MAVTLSMSPWPSDTTRFPRFTRSWKMSSISQRHRASRFSWLLSSRAATRLIHAGSFFLFVWEFSRRVCVHTHACIYAWVCVCFTKYSFVSLVTPEDHTNTFSTSSPLNIFVSENVISQNPFSKYSPAPRNIKKSLFFLSVFPSFLS